MKIALKHNLSGEEVVLETDNPRDPDKKIKIEYTGKPWLIEIAKRELSDSYGFYGHTFNLESTTNLDLSVAARSLESFSVVSIEPEIIPKPLPEGVQS